MDDSQKPEFECEETMERPYKLFQQHYSRKNKDTTGILPLSSNAHLDDNTMPLDESSRIDVVSPRIPLVEILMITN